MQLAIFDLDGTITRRDSFAPYVFGFLLRHPQRLPGLLKVVPAVIRFALDRDRGELKSAVMQAALGGATRAEIAEWNAVFVPSLLEHGLFSRARACVVTHRRAGDRMVLMSASPDLYVPEIARALGFDEVVCTEVRWNGDRLDGRLLSANRRGEEKTRCLARIRERHPGLVAFAYGNSASDLDHLEKVEHGMLINGSKAARMSAAEKGIRCERWR